MIKKRILCVVLVLSILLSLVPQISYADTTLPSGVKIVYPKDILHWLGNEDLPGVPTGSRENFAKELASWCAIPSHDLVMLEKLLDVNVPINYYTDNDFDTPSDSFIADDVTILKAMKDIMFIESMQSSDMKWEEKYYLPLANNNANLNSISNDCYANLQKILNEYYKYQNDTSASGYLLTLEWINQITGVNSFKNKLTGKQNAIQYLMDCEKYIKSINSNKSFKESVLSASGLKVTPQQIVESIKKSLLKTITAQLQDSFGKEFADTVDITKSAYALCTSIIKCNSISALAYATWELQVKFINLLNDQLTDADKYCMTIYDILSKSTQDPRLLNIINNGPNNISLFDKDWNGFSYADYQQYLGDYIPYGFMVYNMANPNFGINQSQVKLYSSIDANIRNNARSLNDEFTYVQNLLQEDGNFGNVNTNRRAINKDIQTLFSIKTIDIQDAKMRLIGFVKTLYNGTNMNTGHAYEIPKTVFFETESNNTNETAQELTKHATVNGIITNGDSDYFKFILDNDGYLNINFLAFDDLDATLSMGNYHINSTNSTDLSGEIWLEKGTYYIDINPNINYSEDYLGAYTFTIKYIYKGSIIPSENEPAPESDFLWNGNEITRYIGTASNIVIPNRCTGIADWAFYSVSGLLTNVSIPNTVTRIGSYAFFNCTSITNINLPNSIDTIGEGAFQYCTGITRINIPDKLTSIEASVFNNCSGLASINLPEGIQYIGASAFEHCSGLTNINIPDRVASIGNRAFAACSGLTSINVNEGVTSIGDKAFAWCSGLTNINIPESVTSMGEGVFYDCTELTNISSLGNIASISKEMFAYCSKLASVEIPNSVTSIGDKAFYLCSKLTSLDIPGGVESIGNWAFAWCSGITNFNIPYSVIDIGDSAFNQCTELLNITLADGVTSIGERTFSNCIKLTSITIPNSVTHIGNWIFSQCTGLKSIIVQGKTLSEAQTFLKSAGVPIGCSISVEPIPVVLESIVITTLPNKTFYIVGENLDITGILITGSYSNDTTSIINITKANVSGFNSGSPAKSQTLTVTVDGKTATFNVSIMSIDCNKDGKVDIDDLVILSLAYGSTASDSRWDERADMNGDGIINFEDLAILANEY